MPQEKEVYTMTQLDNEFFEEYKHLERLCSDMYASFSWLEMESSNNL